MINDYWLIFIFALFMGALAWKDWASYLRGEHIDYKSMIVSTGVLGTFLGIVLGLWDFNTTDIAGSVPILLEGLKLAFLTSIIGMGLSIILAIFEAQPEEKEKPEEDLKDYLEQPLEKINQSLETLISIVEQLNNSYQRHYRFTKTRCKRANPPRRSNKMGGYPRQRNWFYLGIPNQSTEI